MKNPLKASHSKGPAGIPRGAVCLCVFVRELKRMLQPQPEGLVYITRWRQGLAPSIMMLCTKAECEGHRVRDARPMVPAQTCEDNMELGGQTP